MPQTEASRIEELLCSWQERRRNGEALSAEELCHDCPELLVVVRHHIEILGADSPSGTTVKEIVTQRTVVSPTGEPPVIAGYSIEDKLGKGGMGVVYLARQIAANRLVALKMLPGPAMILVRETERFRREALALARLQHPHIVAVYDVGEQHGQPYFSMEYMPGGTLSRKLAGQPLPARASAELVATLAKAMEAAHRAGVIHRDLKPSNVLLAADGTPKIADFGLVKQIEGDPDETPSGLILGTPCYMSPEQAAGRRDIGPAADVYSLGAILYECLTGRPPFRGESPTATISEVLTLPPPPLRQVRREVPLILEAICLKCLVKEPGKRYASAQELADDLERWGRGESTRVRPARLPLRTWRAARRRPVLSVSILLLLVLGGGLLASYAMSPDRDLEAAQREIARDNSWTFIKQTGPPAWYRLLNGEGSTVLSTERDEPFSISTFSITLVELLPEMPSRPYRLSGEFRHDDSSDDGVIGFYTGGRLHEGQRGPAHSFCELSYSDHLVDNVRLPLELSLRIVGTSDPRREPNHRFGLELNGKLPPPENERKIPWRAIALEVRGDGLRLYSDGRLMSQMSRELWLKRENQFRWLRTDPPRAEMPYPMGHSLGLYVYRGTASIRNVRLKPLSD